uniref:Uncharacterized protein n=1 Tax=Lepeophtheirus salmonis TaxID=72036 RepID=A0A0K2V096_LEPSM
MMLRLFAAVSWPSGFLPVFMLNPRRSAFCVLIRFAEAPLSGSTFLGDPTEIPFMEKKWAVMDLRSQNLFDLESEDCLSMFVTYTEETLELRHMEAKCPFLLQLLQFCPFAGYTCLLGEWILPQFLHNCLDPSVFDDEERLVEILDRPNDLDLGVVWTCWIWVLDILEEDLLADSLALQMAIALSSVGNVDSSSRATLVSLSRIPTTICLTICASRQ